ncbi:MAG TPA: isocitrate/isopropylmalate family dehydrogenase [Gaiellaceae bacterium]|nr:isocitrate/isopropylmalate family dehydrogenase [Gaiellaceae bacterium]
MNGAEDNRDARFPARRRDGASLRRSRYVVACLAGHGTGPEMMAEASRALAQVSSLHGFHLDEVHPPFAGEAVTRTGNPLPPATRRATLSADAILVAGPSQPALDGVRAELDLAASVVRVQRPDGDVTIFAPLDDPLEEWTLERAFASACERTGSLVAVGVGHGWNALVERVADRHPGVSVRHLPLAQALQQLATAPASAGVVVTERALADALADAPRLRAGGESRAAVGLLSRTGPGLFAPVHGSAHDLAGQGVANPTEILLAVALLLAEGLGRRAAAETLEESLAAARRRADRTPDAAGGRLAAGTREFVDVVLGLLPAARKDTEFALGGVR